MLRTVLKGIALSGYNIGTVGASLKSEIINILSRHGLRSNRKNVRRKCLEGRKEDARRQLMFNLGKCTQRDAPGDRPWSRRVFWLARKRVNPPRARLITANWMRCEQSVLTLPLSGNMRMRCGRKRKTKTDARTATTTATTATRTKPKLTRKYCRHISTENWYAPSLTLPPPLSTFPRCLAKSLRVWRDAGKSFKHSPLRASTAPPRHDSLWVRTLKLD